MDSNDDLCSFVTWIVNRATNGERQIYKTRIRGRLYIVKQGAEGGEKPKKRRIRMRICLCVCEDSIRAREKMRDIYIEDDSCHRK